MYLNVQLCTMPYRRINIDQQDLDAINANPMWNIQGFVSTAIKNELADQSEISRFMAARKQEKTKLKEHAINQQATVKP